MNFRINDYYLSPEEKKAKLLERFPYRRRVKYSSYNTTQYGYVSSVSANFVFVKFESTLSRLLIWSEVTAQGCYPENLTLLAEDEKWNGYVGNLEQWLIKTRKALKCS